MKSIQRNGTTYFPCGDTLAEYLPFHSAFTMPRSSKVYKVYGKDFSNAEVKASNVEDDQDYIKIPFKSPVTQLKKF